MNYGVTFSHRFAQELGLDLSSSFLKVTELCFDLIRLCLYWDEAQPDSKTISLHQIKKLLDVCHQSGQKVVLTVGMKAPRWPEFYIPDWLPQDPSHPDTQQALLDFLEKVLPELAEYDCIEYWQVENEPLDPSGPKNFNISAKFLEQEITLLRKHDLRPVVLTAWGNDLRSRKFFPVLTELADIVGVDLYDHQHVHLPVIGSKYIGPRDNDEKLLKLFATTQKPIWLSELQAEPWEKGVEEYRAPNPPSMSAAILEEHLQHAQKLQVETVFFWGLEYWLWREAQGDAQYIQFWKRLCGI